MMYLKDWYLVSLTNTVAVGRIYGHPKLPPGSHFQTKRVIYLKDGILMDIHENYNVGAIDETWVKHNNPQELIK